MRQYNLLVLALAINLTQGFVLYVVLFAAAGYSTVGLVGVTAGGV